MAGETLKTTIMSKVIAVEFALSSGIHVKFDMVDYSVTLFANGCNLRCVRTKRLPTIKNAVWLAKNYPPIESK